MFSILLLVCCSWHCAAQDPGKAARYHTWITLSSGTIKGVLYEVKAGSVVMQVPATVTDSSGNYSLLEISADEIRKIKRRRRSGPGIGAAAGFATGVLVGVIAGFAEGDTEGGSIGLIALPEVKAEEKALTYGISLGITGCIAGSLLGLIRKSWIIDGDSLNFEACRQELEAYAVVKD